MTNVFEVQIDGLDELLKRYEQAPEIVEPILQQAVAKSAAILASNTTAKNIPWKTGTLARSFDPADIGHLYARWFPRVDYARYVQEGTNPHWIEPTSGFLYWPGAAHPVARVFHPGTQPAHFMERILESSKGDINELFHNAIGVVAHVMASGENATPNNTSVNVLESGASSVAISGTTSNFSRFLGKISSKAGAKFDQLTYRPFKGSPRGYQIRLAQKFPKLFKRWNIGDM